jgi:type III pantothenate kinase
MNLAIDIGNTQIKAGAFSEGAIVKTLSAPYGQAEAFISGLLKAHDYKAIILSSVVNHSDDLISMLASNYEFVYLSHHTPLPFKNRYLTPETLGKDRLSAIAGAFAGFPGKNILVVDAGTCIKYDFITAGGEYMGGGISPGIQMRYNALHAYTHKLPKISSTEPAILIGQNTEGSIHSGVINGAIAEVEGIIEKYALEFENICVILTGGDSEIFKPLFSGKNNIFADSLLVLKGLNYILEYNVGQKL